MGTNPAPHLADLHCCDKEFAMMNRLKLTNIQVARSFFESYRYIDDILSIDNPSFDNYVKLADGQNQPAPEQQIYPDFLDYC